jgi:flagellar biosynthesis protein FlhA
LRLGLNVASTRIVLSRGHEGTDAAGQVIEAFGEFVISGNFAVGIFVFIILIIINLVVITRGAGRVSEVSARFTLDAMPGKQMAIDADLNAGVLNTEEAAKRREEISSEADFYGAMDGASKFVKGDAIAALLILAVNIIGGLIIGLSQHDMGVGQAAEIYLLLSVGDGLVAQIPSLLLAIATAIIVTRVSSTQNMAAHIGRQVSISSAWIPVSGVLLLIGFMPGMPNFLFLIAALIAASAAYFVHLSEQKTETQPVETEEEVEEKAPDQIELSDVTDNAPISVQIGYGLVEMVDEDAGGPLVNRITSIRKQVSKTLGFVVPPVRIRDDLSLKANQYRIRIGQTIVGEDEAFPNRKLAIPGENSYIQLDGPAGQRPDIRHGCHLDSQRAGRPEAEANNYVVVAPEAVIATHLSSLVYKYAGELIGQDDVQSLLDNLSQTSPNLVESVVPKIVPLHDLTGILRLLLKERVPVSDLRRILEVLPPLSARNLSIEETAEALRPDLASLLIQQVAPLNTPLPVITFDGELEHMLINMQRQSPEGELILDTELAQRLLENLTRVNEQLSAEGRQAVVVVSPIIRRSLARIIRQHIDDIVVIAFSELPETRKVDVVATIGSDPEQNSEQNSDPNSDPNTI